MTAHHRRLNLPEPPPLFRVAVGVLLAFHRRFPDIADAWYVSGYIAGLQAGLDRGGYSAGVREGWRQRVEQDYAAFRVMAHNIRVMARTDPFAEVAARRLALPPGYQPRPVPSYDECMWSWGTGTEQAPRD